MEDGWARVSGARLGVVEGREDFLEENTDHGKHGHTAWRGRVGGWVGGWVGAMVEEEEAVRMSYCGLLGGGWVGKYGVGEGGCSSSWRKKVGGKVGELDMCR